MKKQNIIFVPFVTIVCAFQLVMSVKASEPIQVVVSIPPQTYFVKQVGGELVDVMSMLPEGGLPHTYEPGPQQMKQLNNADMYVRIKVEFENAWWEKMMAVNPDMYVVDSTESVRYIEGHAHEHHEEEGEAHEHHGRDPHIWLSPRMVKIQAENIYQGLIAVDPEHNETYTANKEAFMSMLESLDAEIQARLANLKTRKFMIFHPAWSYFARDYNLEQIPVEVEGKEPTAKEMTDLMKLAKQEHVVAIFVQPQTSQRSAETIATQIGAKVEILDPLAADWLENIRHVTNILAETLSE